MKPDQWTPADEANYQELTERRERVQHAQMLAVHEVVKKLSKVPSEFVGYTTQEIIHYAQELRDALAPFDSGVRCAEPPALDGWIEWGGGACPVPAGSDFEVRCRNGETELNEKPNRNWDWTHDGSSYDIIAYRVVSK